MWVAGKGAEITRDIRKTMSYVEKIMSDVVFSTSDIIFALSNL